MGPNIAEPVRDTAVEKVRVPRAEHFDLVADCDLEFPLDDDASLTRIVLEHGGARIGPRFVTFVKDLQVMGLCVADLTEAQSAMVLPRVAGETGSQVDQLAGTEENLVA